MNLHTIGFTGTRNGMTDAQRDAVIRLLGELAPAEVVHGDCVGADADLDQLCAARGIERHIRPCTFEKLRAHCEERGARVIAEPKRPMARNRDIVSDADDLIACPPNFERMRKGSGTWATVMFGVRAEIAVHVVYPDGTVERWGAKE